ncbi:EG45-like domain containing protein [Morella rubra]|uniref:EG45-like domain containing protein n=1 Tax=Morella rubra TaxID=262757 RepID=A0A6A1VAL9_9ROSI|nr:EG45-like domain containing protein [Morella rubra]
MGTYLKLFVMVLGMAGCLVFVDCAANGTASFFRPPYTRNACGRKHTGTLIAVAGNSTWEKGRTCGRKYSVQCIGAINHAPHPCKPVKVVVEIVDHCPHCHETLSLSEDAFAKIANVDAGIVKIEYSE